MTLLHVLIVASYELNMSVGPSSFTIYRRRSPSKTDDNYILVSLHSVVHCRPSFTSCLRFICFPSFTSCPSFTCCPSLKSCPSFTCCPSFTSCPIFNYCPSFTSCPSFNCCSASLVLALTCVVLVSLIVVSGFQ